MKTCYSTFPTPRLDRRGQPRPAPLCSPYLRRPLRSLETACRDRWGGAWLCFMLRLADGLPVYDGVLLVEEAARARAAGRLA